MKNIVFTSAGDNTSFDEMWIEGNRNYDIWVVYYGENESNYKKYKEKVDFIEKRKGSKFQNFYYVYHKYKELLSNYERFFILDDDIIITTKNINLMFKISEYYNLSICQPSFDVNSKISWVITEQNTKNILRYTNWVELCVPLFNKSALDNFFNYYKNELIGWGIDYLYIWLNGINHKKSYAIIDSISCINPHDESKGGFRELKKVNNWQNLQNLWEEYREKHKIKEWFKVNHSEIRKVLD